MSLSEMYPAKNNSPKTSLSAAVTASASSITVSDASVLPDAPNLAVIGTEIDAEIIKYSEKSGNTLNGITRGINGTEAKAWTAGTIIARNFTAYDHEMFRNNILELQTSKSDLIVETVTGAIVNFDNAAESPLTGLVAQIEPVQSGSGDPSPDNICPITGWGACKVTRTGKNLLPSKGLDTQDYSGITWKRQSDGSILATGTASSVTSYRIVPEGYNFMLKAGTYICTGQQNGNQSIGFAPVDGTVFFMYKPEGQTFTLEKDTTFQYIYIRIAEGQVLNNVVFQPMIRLASDPDTTYEPYNSTIYDISFRDIGTVYGGTLDVTTGELVVTKAGHVFDGTETITNNAKRYSWAIPSSIFAPVVSTKSENAISSIYRSRTASVIWQNRTTDAFMGVAAETSTGGTRAVHFMDSTRFGENQISEYKAYLTELYISGTPFTVVWNLANPLTYHLTSTQIDMFLGVNNIFTDTGDITVEYLTKIADSLVMHLNEQMEISDSTSGSLITLNNAVDAPVGDLKVSIEPVQDLHGYDAPWGEGARKNLWKPFGGSLYGVTFTVQSDGSVKASGTVTTRGWLYASRNELIENSIFGIGDAFVLKAPVNGQITLRCYDSENIQLSQISASSGNTNTGTIPANTYRITYIENVGTSIAEVGDVINQTLYYQLEKGTTISDTWTPYSNICPINGFSSCKITSTGKNLFPNDRSYPFTSKGVTVTKNADDSITLSGAKNETSAILVNLHVFSENIQKYNGMYLKSQISSSIGIVVTYYDANGAWVSAQTGVNIQFNIPQRAKRMNIQLRIATNDDVTGTVLYPMICQNQNDPYEPFGKTVTIDLDGTRYGGFLDITTGKLTLTQYGFTADGVNYYATGSSTASGKRYYTFTFSTLGLPKSINSNSGNADEYLCDIALFGENSAKYNYCYVAGSGNAIYFFTTENMQSYTKDQFNTYLQTHNIQFVYLLAEPITYQLSPAEVCTINGLNHIWADTGDITSLTYYKQSGAGIAEAVSNASSIAKLSDNQTRGMVTQSSESAMIASKNYAVGDLLIADNRLLRTTANIAIDGTITIGTNAEVVDLNTVIKEKAEKLTTFPMVNNAGAHNSIYRGISLGSSVTADQWAAISAGTFDNMFIGDYWTINNIVWRIAGFDYWYNTGDTACTTHHVIIVPDSNLTSTKVNSTNTIDGAYLGSDFYTGNNDNSGKATANSKIETAFDGASHILSKREYLSYEVNNGYETKGKWVDSTWELMSEVMLFGSNIFHNAKRGDSITPIYDINKSQLPLFRLDHKFISMRISYWLRDVADDTCFSCVGVHGTFYKASASTSYGIRPAIGIKA